MYVEYDIILAVDTNHLLTWLIV